MQVTVIDSECGTGKTQYAIDYMTDNSNNVNFIYVTPFLNEVTRVRNSVGFKMYEPKSSSKSRDLLSLVEKGVSIATTHALFGLCGIDFASLIGANRYELILDEVLDVLSPMNLKAGDVEILVSGGYVGINDDNTVYVTEKGEENSKIGNNYASQFDIIRSGRVILVADRMMLWEFPIDLLKHFRKITILTYMFDGQTMCNYLKSFGVNFDFYHLEDYKLTRGISCYSGEKYINLIDIYEGKMNGVGDKPYSLSSTWYSDKNNSKLFKILGNNTRNYFLNILSKRSGDCLWTCPQRSNDMKYLAVKDYSSSFLVMNSRATNDYAERDACAYLVNRFENPVIHNYFVKHNLSINNDLFALSELIQWLFRSAIRRNKSINLYIPSKRMREILQAWLEGTFEDKYNKGGVSETK